MEYYNIGYEVGKTGTIPCGMEFTYFLEAIRTDAFKNGMLDGARDGFREGKGRKVD